MVRSVGRYFEFVGWKRGSPGADDAVRFVSCGFVGGSGRLAASRSQQERVGAMGREWQSGRVVQVVSSGFVGGYLVWIMFDWEEGVWNIIVEGWR